MKLAELFFVFVTAISVLTGIADAAVTAWTNPPIPGSATGRGIATPSIAEGAGVGSIGITISATVSGSPTYAILSQKTAGKMSIDGSYGILNLNSGTFDFETEPTYVLVITCTDSSGGTVGTATVTLSINDQNDAPIFAKDQYSATIPDGSKAGTALIAVAAIDVDAGDTLVYSITGGNTPAHWKINGLTGKVTVNDAITLDQSTFGGYSLTITVTDSIGATDTTTVWVAVTTCNSG